MLPEPLLTTRREDERDIPVLIWRAEGALRAVSSAPLGGGIGVRRWVLNATVPMSYDRNDPADHLAGLAREFDLDGPGVGLMTGVDVAEVVRRTDTGVLVWATVGLGTPVPAAAPTAAAPTVAASAQPVGTVNIVAYVPARLGDAALVNAVATATEAKAQAIAELGLPGTGTPTDAVAVLCPSDGPINAYGGPRSTWGAPLARAVHAAVLSVGRDTVVPWSDRLQG
ncbi:adenosylcobinamide amidohydrolase [Micromonospora sediminimaris]|uniref:Adenosylcobinamide amidohydrolase n=1 Tax=Micromonospora sediminimaris TaxID=547162 RepID=A0A9W5UTW4_9ACTN|nr:adenosylcobinamide amidohydrolase [Micromonospora sediminimaris]GIJ34148.1 adenosylcobinamide amidohydrolase [Micromonospora sediminimaris]SFD57488.1 Adenosylcobinamide amidohydrolase [Micromonospora sediminimaris]